MSLYAEIDADSRVLRVVVCDSLEWLQARMPGNWVLDVDERSGPGLRHWEGVFLRDWALPPDVDSAYGADACVWYAGQPWESTVAGNTAIPGTVGWSVMTLAWYVSVYRAVKNVVVKAAAAVGMT